MTGSGWAARDVAPDRISPEENERRDETMLRGGGSAFRVAVIDRAALSVGIGVRPPAEYLRRAWERGLPIVHRSTGGTGVLLGADDLAWTVVLPRGDPRVRGGPSRSYAPLGAPLVALLARRGIASSWDPAPGLSRDSCLLGERGRVLGTARGILSGAAQHLSRDTLLHHGILPRRIDRPAHRAIFDAKGLSAFDRLIGTDELGIQEPAEELGRELGRELARWLVPS